MKGSHATEAERVEGGRAPSGHSKRTMCTVCRVQAYRRTSVQAVTSRAGSLGAGPGAHHNTELQSCRVAELQSCRVAELLEAN